MITENKGKQVRQIIYTLFQSNFRWLCVFSNTKATFETQFMKRFNNTEGELKKKRVIQGSFSDKATTDFDFTDEAAASFPSSM